MSPEAPPALEAEPAHGPAVRSGATNAGRTGRTKKSKEIVVAVSPPIAIAPSVEAADAQPVGKRNRQPPSKMRDYVG